MATAAIHQDMTYVQHQNCVTNNVTEEVNEPTDLHLLKEVSEKLHLATRRPSTVQWKQVIEFRKSMGLYSSDVEPEFLDNLVEAQMKKKKSTKGADKQVTKPSKTKSSQVKLEKETKTVEDRLNNNISDKKASKEVKTKSKKFKTSKKSSKKDEKNIKANSNLTSNTQVTTKSKTNSPDEIRVSNSNENKSATSLDTVSKAACDVITGVSNNGTNSDSLAGRIAEYDTDDDDVTTGLSDMGKRYHNVNKALAKLRRDLITMRMEDNILARKLLDARREIILIKAHRSCDAHADVIDDVTYELEEEDLLPGLLKACDLPGRPPGSLLSAFSPLRNIGLSRMNLNRRRFSIR